VNSSLPRPRRKAPPASRDWRGQLEDWRRLLGECRLKPTRKRVHFLRVATLRLQAQILHWLEAQSDGNPHLAMARQWHKQAKSLRKTLGDVRALDVHLGNLRRLGRMLTTDSGYAPRSSRATLRQIGELENRFKRKRKDAAKDLLDALAAHHMRLEHVTSELASASPFQEAPLQPLTADQLSKMLVTALAAFPGLDAHSLHDFRKQLKSMRYLAEQNTSSREVVHFVATVKGLQAAIGTWHDWEELAAESARMARRRTEARALTDLLETLAHESLAKALASCEDVRDQLLHFSPASVAAPPAKKPVRRADAAGPRAHLISA
jgi:CHAD domain-containing protein